MTLAVGCKIPWTTPGTLASLRPDEVVFLLADSRWTYPDDPRKRDDDAQKIFRVHKHLAVVYAGDVPAAERSIEYLRKALRRSSDTTAEVVAKAASEALGRGFGEIGRRDLGLWALAGGRNAIGHGFLIYLSHETEFKPIFLDGHPFPIGPKHVCEAYRSKLKSFAGEKSREGNPLRTAQDWLTASFAALDSLIQGHIDPGVGGKIQTGVISESGFWEIEYAVLAEVAEPPKRDKWRRPTRRLKELRRYLT